MRYSDMRAHNEDRTKKGNLTKRAAKALATVRVPPATPTRPVTGLDEHGQAAGDLNGNVYLKHSQGYMSMREVRRANRFGRFDTQPMRSRIQRSKRKQRTGGVK
jgi:hypothetical protein